MKKSIYILYLLLPLLFSSCIKEGFDKEHCPGEYKVIPIIQDEHTSFEYKDTIITILDENGIVKNVNPDTLFDLDDGNYTIVVTGSNEGNHAINGTEISAPVDDEGYAEDTKPFVGGYTEFTAANGVDPIKKVNSANQTRPLVVRIKFEGENSSFIDNITGFVEGIALKRDLNNGFAPVDGTRRPPATLAGDVKYNFEVGEENIYSDTRVLIGIDGNGKQILNFTITYDDGTEKTYTFDITTDMDGFHTENVEEPWVISIVLRLGADFNAIIEDWKVGPEYSYEAH